MENPHHRPRITPNQPQTMKTKSPKFHNKNGTLTAYSFACGYLEVYHTNADQSERLAIYREPNDWHVKGRTDGGPKWEIFETLKEARAYCRKHGKLKLPRY